MAKAREVGKHLELIQWSCAKCDTRNWTPCPTKRLVCKKCGAYSDWDQDKGDWKPMERGKKLHWWKCQQCGLTFSRVSSGEPRRCPVCFDRGAKSYEGRGVKGPQNRKGARG